ncbi:MAG: PAS domain-containing protein, partial [Coleofasciculus sp. S288]|nr:PAS domain-containing protein [Coleofasciculus sp. S288]
LINDLTTLKQADAERERLLQELQTERARFEAVLQQMPAGVMIADAASGKLILTNEQAKQMIGYAYEQSLVIEEYEPIVPFEGFRLDSQRYAPEEYPLARSLRTGEVVANEEMKLHRGDGRCIFMSVNSAPILDNQEQIVAAVVVFQDVTARKQVEENLRLSENRYRTLANAVSQLMWINDVNGNIQLFNQRWQEYTGVEDLELGVGLWRDIIHPDDFHSTLEKRTQAIQAGEAYELECRLKRFDQTYRWHLARIVPLKDEEGRVLQWYGTATDIHYVKQIEADLRESEAIARARAQELETLMEITPAALWIAHDPNCHHMSANQMAYELMRATPGSVTTATPPDGSYLLQFKQKRNGQEVPPYDLPMQRAARTGQEVTDEMEFIFEDGTVRFIYGKAVPLRNETGDVRGVIGAFVDITERKRVEETLRENQERLSIAQQAGRLGVFDVDLRTDENVWSLEMQALYGLQPGEFDGTYQAWLGSLHPDDREKAQRELERALKTGEYAEDFRVIWPDGSIHWLYSRATIFFDAAGNPLRMLGVNVDISDRKQAEREREQLLARERVAREEAEAANRIKDEFLAVLSHELRSPLNPILGWAKLLRSRRLDEQATTRALETIERNAKLQAQLIEDLLDVSRILRGKLVLNVAPVNLAATIEAALETMRLAAEAKGIQIQTVLAPNVGRVKGDSARLQQVVWNLLSNAIKFTPTGGRVEVRLKQVDKYAQIQVKDKGKGITTEFLPHVFEYFRQADGTTTRQFGGLGLGLAIVRHLVELHGGSVQAESPGEGLGATFTVKLPLIENVPENNPHDRQDAATDLSGVRVLVVDDEADMRELVAFILEESGAEVQVAASATEALEKLEQFQQDILISDIGMPHVDGYMLMQQVRERFPQHGRPSPALSQAMPKAIALTAYAGEFNQQQALAAGFERHLSKPVEPNELVRAIATLVNR